MSKLAGLTAHSVIAAGNQKLFTCLKIRMLMDCTSMLTSLLVNNSFLKYSAYVQPFFQCFVIAIETGSEIVSNLH